MRSLRTVSELTEELRVLPTGMRIIAIDGRCAAGKTTLAARLAKELGGDVIHMDDFFSAACTSDAGAQKRAWWKCAL